MSYETLEAAKVAAKEGDEIYEVYNWHFDSTRFEINPSDRESMLSEYESWEEV